MKNLLCYVLFIIIFITTGCFKNTVTKIGDEGPAGKIQTIVPNADCPTKEARPIFSWMEFKTNREDVKYRFVIVEMKDNQDARSAIENNEKLANEKDIEKTSIELPTIASDLKPNSIYAFQISAYGKTSGKIYSKSDVVLFETLDSSLPDESQNYICCEVNLLRKPLINWKSAYGDPETNGKETSYLASKGTIQMTGNHIGGDCVYQILDNKIKKDNNYQISFFAKPLPKETDYVRFLFIAYNGSLPTNGSHPEITDNKVVIGESEDIESDEWNRYFLPVWKAPNDFAKLAVLVVTNENTIGGVYAIGSISNICLQQIDD